MNRVSLILTALMMLSLTIFMAPNVIAMNRGRILQTIALWLAIFLGLTVAYKTFGPDSPHPLFQFPNGMTGGGGLHAPVIPTDQDRG